MLNIAHRGFSGVYPENTMLAFEKAMEAGCDGIELDVQLTKDGVPVIMHDEKVDRTTDGTGYLKDYTFAKIRKLNAKYRYEKSDIFCEVPSLREYFELVKDKNIFTNVELKNSVILYENLEEKVLDLIDEYDLRDRILISSFNHLSVVKMKKMAPDMKYGFLEESIVLDAAKYAKRYEIDYLHPSWQSVTEEYCRQARKEGVEINTWTVNDLALLKKMQTLQIHGVITNFPDRVKALQKERERTE